MPEDRYELVAVHSNVDRLSVSAVRDLFTEFVYRSVHAGEDWLRLVIPKGQTLGLERHIGVHGPTSLGDLISAELGVAPVESARTRGSADYALWVDQGSGMFGADPHMIHPTVAKAMRWNDIAGNTIFARATKGQRPRMFMLDTFEQMTRVAMPVEAARMGERIKHLYADPIVAPSAA
jgi:hypothetical protein